MFTPSELVTLARSWPACEIDRTILLDLADALEVLVEETSRKRPVDGSTEPVITNPNGESNG